MKGKKIFFYLSYILIICGIFIVYNYLSFGNYGTPFGVNIEEMDNRVIIQEYDWKGSVSNQFQLENLKENNIELEVLESQFKKTFSILVTLALILLSGIYIKISSNKLNVSTNKLDIPVIWSRIFFILLFGLFVVLSIMTILQYNDLIIQSENLLNELDHLK
ncbi:hypothetical protein [Halobacillus hunanensis]|uniref:hypothetical protein n=1 Tax=Halobacillus hunanensis TaxID=578214 RepID=UPI0009A7A467|nr:hypothetical protein [Halobacillus hunanensis]